MIQLTTALTAWGTQAFEETLKTEIERLGKELLPLQEGLSGTSCVSDEPHRAIILSTADQGDSIRVRAGIFYSGILSGCSCADDPTPIEAQNEYCQVDIVIRKQRGEASITLVP